MGLLQRKESRLIVLMEKDLREWLGEYSAERGQTMSEVVRELIRVRMHEYKHGHKVKYDPDTGRPTVF